MGVPGVVTADETRRSEVFQYRQHLRGGIRLGDDVFERDADAALFGVRQQDFQRSDRLLSQLRHGGIAGLELAVAGVDDQHVGADLASYGDDALLFFGHLAVQFGVEQIEVPLRTPERMRAPVAHAEMGNEFHHAPGEIAVREGALHEPHPGDHVPRAVGGVLRKDRLVDRDVGLLGERFVM